MSKRCPNCNKWLVSGRCMCGFGSTDRTASVTATPKIASVIAAKPIVSERKTSLNNSGRKTVLSKVLEEIEPQKQQQQQQQTPQETTTTTAAPRKGSWQFWADLEKQAAATTKEGGAPNDQQSKKADNIDRHISTENYGRIVRSSYQIAALSAANSRASSNAGRSTTTTTTTTQTTEDDLLKATEAILDANDNDKLGDPFAAIEIPKPDMVDLHAPYSDRAKHKEDDLERLMMQMGMEVDEHMRAHLRYYSITLVQ
jgi:hypothetical protein